MNIRIGTRIVGENMPAFIIAELGINHEGSFNRCKKLVVSAKKAGANAVKLQINIPEKNYIKGSYSYKIFKKAFLNKEEIKKIFEFSKKLNLDIFSTSTDNETVDFIDKLNPIAHKISSSSLTNIPLIENTAKKKKLVILSTGMANEKDINNAINAVKKNRNQKIILMHCVSIYPTKTNNTNLRTIKWLKKKYNFLVGYSDHTKSNLPISLSIASGACIIEKHFTFDMKRKGFDHKISYDEKKFKEMINIIRESEQALGSEEKVLSKEELLNSYKLQRVLVSKFDLKKGEKLSKKNLDIKRPLKSIKGIKPYLMNKLLGKKIKKNIKKDTPIKFNFIKKSEN